MKSVGIVGCGAIGTLIAEAIEKRIVECDELLLYDRDLNRSETLKSSLRVRATVLQSVDDMIRLKPAVIIEVASVQAAKDYVPRILAKDIDLIVMSVGGLLELKAKSRRLHVPPGAIGGLDALSNASLAGIDEVILTTTKSPRTLGLTNHEQHVAYEGSAEEAVRRFPREMNVAARLALAAGSDKVKVRVVSDPKVDRNVHEVGVKWKHGNMLLRFCNDPHPDNPKTSALAAWSAIRMLKDVLERHS